MIERSRDDLGVPDRVTGLVLPLAVALFRVTGPVVLELQYIFAADWFVETNEVLDSETEFPCPAVMGGIPAQALASGPAFPNSKTLGKCRV